MQEQTVKRGETLAEELKASQEKSASQASELHAKEVEVLQNQVDKLKQELSSSKDKSEELAKSVSELQAYKEQAQVRTFKVHSHSGIFTLLFPRHSHPSRHVILIFNWTQKEYRSLKPPS